MKVVPLLALACALAACGSDPDPAPGADPWAYGYKRTEQLRDGVSSVERVSDGIWRLELRNSARVYHIDGRFTPRAAELAAAALALQANGHEMYFTVLVHANAPTEKAASSETRPVRALHPWIIDGVSATPST